jgi:HEAT repeats
MPLAEKEAAGQMESTANLITMPLARRTLLATLLLTVASTAWAKPGLDELIGQLQGSKDFRVRVQAALQLGRSMDPAAFTPLVAGLDDENASVRAAAVAALESLGDMRAIAPLREHRLDRSDAVRKQIKASLAELESQGLTTPKPKLLVKIGIMRNGSGVKSKRIESDLAQASRQKLGELPGVKVLVEGDDGAGRKTPVVMVTGSVEQLVASREGSAIVYTAKVEYVVHTMPEQSIAAKVSGSASAQASEQEANDQTKSAQLRKDVLEAAIASALKRAPPALVAAARL